MVEMSFDEIMRDVRERQMEGMMKAAKQAHGRDLSSDGYRPVLKSSSACPDVGRRIASVRMVKSSSGDVSARPATTSSVNGDAIRPTLDSIRKSVLRSSRPAAAGGVEGLKASARYDWDEYNAFISNNE